jgi:hypothetical protein
MEDALDRCSVFSPAVITVDVWDIDRLVSCGGCRAGRVERLERINLTADVLPRVTCATCGAA